MKAPISWLKEYVDINVDIDTLCKAMVSIGLEIEEVINLADTVKGIVVGKVLTVEAHPDADRLNCLTIDIGNGVIPIVTNDKNVVVGNLVPVALDKAVLADGTVIKAGKMRGQPSLGMLCGLEELGINTAMYHTDNKDGVLILRDNAIVGQNIIDVVGLNDYIIDVAVTSNRQDCNSIYGLAREVAVALGGTVKPIDISYNTIDRQTTDYIAVDIQDSKLCPNYYMQGLVDVNIKPSPEWMTRRLYKCGHNAINNIVDITNYCLVEVGQPMHAFDYRYLPDKTIVVRRATNGEKLVALDNKEYTLNSNNLVIANKTTPIGLAGIMGGADSGIKEDTSIVMFESARFARENIRHSSRDLSLRSDSSARFEKGIDAYTTDLGLSRALHLVEKLGCANILGGRIDGTGYKPATTTITFDTSRIKQLLGIDIDDNKVIQILSSLQFDATIKDGIISCVVPPYRDDCTRDCDIIEEIIRVYGYDNIVGTMMNNSHITKGGKSEFGIFVDNIKQLLVHSKYSEAIFYPFAGKMLYDKLTINNDYDVSTNIRLLNPIGEELSLMNKTLVANMLQCFANNHSKKNTSLKMFECGKVYLTNSLPLASLPTENNRLCIAVSGADYDTIRNVVLSIIDMIRVQCKFVRSQCSYLHPGISADIVVDKVTVGCFGKLHPKVASNFDLLTDTYVADIDMDRLYSAKCDSFQFEHLSKLQPVKRDIAVVVAEDIGVQDIADCVQNSNKLIAQAVVFDVFRSDMIGSGNKSVALSVTIAPKDNTLSDKEIDKIMTRAIDILKTEFGAVLR